MLENNSTKNDRLPFVLAVELPGPAIAMAGTNLIVKFPPDGYFVGSLQVIASAGGKKTVQLPQLKKKLSEMKRFKLFKQYQQFAGTEKGFFFALLRGIHCVT